MNRLRTLITVEQLSSTTPDEYNESAKVWVPFKSNIWASIKPLSGRQLEFARSFSHTVNYSVLIRFHKGILQTHRINSKGRIFNIGAVLDQDAKGNFAERGIWMTIFCTESPTDNPVSEDRNYNGLTEDQYNNLTEEQYNSLAEG